MTDPQYRSPTSADGGTFTVDESDRKVQKTRHGHEIPVPSKGKTLRDFEKIPKSEKSSKPKK